jgi:hypothetical protein
MASEFPGGGENQGFIMALLGYLLDGLNFVLFILSAIWAWIRDVLVRYVTELARAVAQGFPQLWGGLGRVLGWLKRFWTDLLKPLLRAIADGVQWLQRFLHRIFDPIIQVLTDLRKFLQRIYDTFLRPILDLIDLFRTVLRGLSVLGVDWARELDAKLAEFQRLISAPLLEAIKRVNEIASWIDRIVTLDGLFQRLIWLRTLAAYQRPVFRWAWNSQSTPLTGGEVDTLRRKNRPGDLAVLRADFLAFVRFGSGPMAPKIEERAVIFRDRLRSG